MASYSKTSAERLATCHPSLQKLFSVVIKKYDHSILCGHRNKVDQDTAVAEKKSKTPWPTSKHNSVPSMAVDAAPYPIKWGTEGTPEERRKDINRFYFFAGFVKATAEELGINVRWGGDWDGDFDFNDQNFDDLVHWELGA